MGEDKKRGLLVSYEQGVNLLRPLALMFIPMMAALDVETVRVTFTQLFDVSLHDLVKGEAGGFAEQTQIPEQITDLFTELGYVEFVAVVEHFFEVIDNFACLACEAKGADGEQFPLIGDATGTMYFLDILANFHVFRFLTNTLSQANISHFC